MAREQESQRSHNRYIEAVFGFIARAEEFCRKYPLVVWVAPILLIGLSVAGSHGGIRHPEADTYIPHYLSDRPLIEKIYDTNHVEMPPDFRPRPLSHVVDNFNVAFIGWCCIHGFPHFLSLSNYLFWVLDCALLWVLCSRILTLDMLTTGLMMGLFSANQIVLGNVWFFHAANPGAALFLLMGFVLLAFPFQKETKAAWIYAVSGCAALLASFLFDEIALGFASTGLLMICMEMCFEHHQRSVRRALAICLSAIVAALLLFLLYDLAIHPKMVRQAIGVTPSFTYQTALLPLLIAAPLRHLAAAILLLLDGFSFTAGGIPAFWSLLGLLALYFVWRRTQSGSRLPAWIRLGFCPALLIGCLYVMVSRHPPLGHMATGPSNYLYTFAVALTLLLCWTARLIVNLRIASRAWVQISLAVLIVTSVSTFTIAAVSQWPSDLETVSRLMLRSLRDNVPINPSKAEDAVTAGYYREAEASPAYRALFALRQTTAKDR